MQENDYFGMAQDLRRMRERFWENCNWRLLPWSYMAYYNSLKEFETYCLNQPYE